MPRGGQSGVQNKQKKKKKGKHGVVKTTNAREHKLSHCRAMERRRGSRTWNQVDKEHLEIVHPQVAAELDKTRQLLNVAYSTELNMYEDNLAPNGIHSDSYTNTDFADSRALQHLRGKLPDALFQESHDPHDLKLPPKAYAEVVLCKH